jgi:hypothetical protein
MARDLSVLIPVTINDAKGLPISNSKPALTFLCGEIWSACTALTPAVTPVIVAEGSLRPIFLCGDSHCLSPAWSVVYIGGSSSDSSSSGSVSNVNDSSSSSGSDNSSSNANDVSNINDNSDSNGDSNCCDSSKSEADKILRGSPRLLVPHLVTGLKQWHLRPEGRFYPKYNFQQTIGSIPSGAEVSTFYILIVLCGSIIWLFLLSPHSRFISTSPHPHYLTHSLFLLRSSLSLVR